MILNALRFLELYKSKLQKLGKPTGEMDALIAATAMAHKAVIVTGNRKHFENIEGLKVETWPTW